MVRRRVTTSQNINIAKQVRGRALEQAVVLSIVENGILISPYRPGAPLPAGNCGITEFDQYNRVHLPQHAMTAVNIKRDVEVIKNDDGTLLIRAIPACVGCGCTGGIMRELQADKHICLECLQRGINLLEQEGVK